MTPLDGVSPHSFIINDAYTALGNVTLSFTADADLGWLAGGKYEYDGSVEGDDFQSTYNSKGDHGTFEMQRVK